MITFQMAKELIKKGDFFDTNLINFNINELDIDYDYEFHDSNSYENEYKITQERTLLHIAINCKNKKAIAGLLRAGVDRNIPVTKTTERKQRSITSGSSAWGAVNYGHWESWSPIIEKTKTVELAEITKDPEIIEMIRSRVTEEPIQDKKVESPKKDTVNPTTNVDEKNKKSPLVIAAASSSSKSDENAYTETDKKDSSAKLAGKVSDQKTLNVNQPKAAMPREGESPVDEIQDQLGKNLAVSPYKGKVIRKAGEKEKRKVHLYGFPNHAQAREQELSWLKYTVAKFFRVGKPLKEGKESTRLHKVIVDYLSSKDKKPVNIDGMCRRSFIIALSKILTENTGMPKLEFCIGNTIIRFIPSENNGTNRQKGNFKIEIGDCLDIKYGAGCITRLKYLYEANWDDSTDKSLRKKRILALFKAKLQRISTFTPNNFNKYGNIFIDSDRDTGSSRDQRIQQNIHFLNGLLLLVTTVEVLVRLYRSADGNIYPYTSQAAIKSDSFPVAIAQSRSLIMLIEGRISFEDFLGESIRDNYDKEQHRAYYGTVTGRGTIDNIDIMFEKLFAVNTTYNSTVSNLDFWKDLRKVYLSDNKDGCLVEGRSRMYFDLVEVYGSGAESDDGSSSYSSDEDISDIVEFKL